MTLWYLQTCSSQLPSHWHCRKHCTLTKTKHARGGFLTAQPAVACTRLYHGACGSTSSSPPRGHSPPKAWPHPTLQCTPRSLALCHPAILAMLCITAAAKPGLRTSARRRSNKPRGKRRSSSKVLYQSTPGSHGHSAGSSRRQILQHCSVALPCVNAKMLQSRRRRRASRV